MTAENVQNLTGELNVLLADVFAIYIKTKNFHWHVSGPHFRDYHLLLDEQAEQVFTMTDDIAERIRKLGGNTIRSIGPRANCVSDSGDTEIRKTVNLTQGVCGVFVRDTDRRGNTMGKYGATDHPTTVNFFACRPDFPETDFSNGRRIQQTRKARS